LLALGGEAVDEQREVDVLALRADALAVGLERPISVDLPSSTEPQVMKRSSDLCWCWRR
jgi:hypothetical protein